VVWAAVSVVVFEFRVSASVVEFEVWDVVGLRSR
jgi:hypothetical protein